MANKEVQLGYALSSEEWGPSELVELAEQAERTGFSFALISDHYHPWVERQGNSPFVWSVLGGIARATKRLEIGTGVTCPINRIHPAIIAQAAATVASMMPGRFFLGVGTGENLNEHINAFRWPEPSVRREMLREAVEVIRLLWKGGFQSHRGHYFTVENARVFNLPKKPTPIYVAASGKNAAKLAGEIGDGFISTAPEKELVDAFAKRGDQRPRYGQFAVCVDRDEEKARRIALEIWPNAGIPGDLSWELPLPAHFEQAAELVDEETIAESVICSRDPEKHVEMIQKFADAGFDHVYIHQIGPDQKAFFRLYGDEIIPRLRKAA